MGHHMSRALAGRSKLSGQSNDCLRVCNVKMKKIIGAETGHISKNVWVTGHSVNWFELISSKMVKLDEEECWHPKMSDLVKFSTLACLTSFFGSITLYSFLNLILVWFWCLSSKLMISSTRIWSNFATRGPIRHLKMAKCVQKLASSAILGALVALLWQNYFRLL